MMLRWGFLLICFVLMPMAKGWSNEPAHKGLDAYFKLQQSKAVALIDQLDFLPKSAYWPEVNPKLFVENIRLNVLYPDSIHQGKYTNFCGYAVATYLYAQYDPVTYVSNMLDLYKHGEMRLLNSSVISPPFEVRRVAGSLQNKGVMVSRPADQMWYLALSAHFRGPINFLNRRFQRGDENTIWASMEYPKLNRLLQALFWGNIDKRSKGAIANANTHMAKDIMGKLSNGTIILFADDTFKTKGKKKHMFPKHYLVIHGMEPTETGYKITYWDYAAVKQIELKKRVFERAARGYSVLQLDQTAYLSNTRHDMAGR